MTDIPAERLNGAEDIIWDLSIYYERIDDPRLDADLARAAEMAADLSKKYRGRIAGMDGAQLAQVYQDLEALYELLGGIASYAFLNFSVYSTDPAWGALAQKVDEGWSQIQQELVFVELEWNALDDETAARILADPALGVYRYQAETTRARKPYNLSEPEERIIIMKDVTGASAWNRYFEQVMAAQTFDWEGQTINQSQLLSRLHDASRDVRQRAANMLTARLEEQKMTLTFIFNTLVADKAAEDKVRGFPGWISSRNLSNKAPDEVVEALVSAVTSRYDIVARHYRTKRALLGYDELYDYDRYAPLNLRESEAFYSWGQARDIVLEAYHNFSPRMADIARRFFDERWIHAPILAGKRGGAYASYGTKGTHPFVFVNYNGTANDVMTLAHELGHGVHMYLSAEAQPPVNISTPLTTAEMASTFGEMVVFQDLLAKEVDQEVQLAMLAQKVEETFATVFRQIAMNRFEHGMHTARRTEGELPTERLNQIWLETQKAMFGDSVTMRDEYGQWWSYVPHFLRTPGYVYAYSFGELLVLALYNRYQAEGAPFVPKYESLLAAGDSDYPHNLLATVGVDLNDPGFWSQGLDILEEMVAREERLARQLYPTRF